ncbi:MAG: squalene/phytoene synthase family protein [Candidatus Kapaibacterium sp.]
MAVAPDILQELLTESGGRYATKSLDQAYAFCGRMAASHYENFPVASRLLRRDVRPHIAAVYAFARLADDIADELAADAGTKERLLRGLLDMLRTGGTSTHPVVHAAWNTMERCALPRTLPERLVRAFTMDSGFRQPESWENVRAYCRLSADPIGETVLRIHGISDAQVIAMSDDVCTALQLVNFWQDQSVDHARGRCYVPRDLCVLHGLRYAEGSLQSTAAEAPETFTERLCSLYDTLFRRTRDLLASGPPLLAALDERRLRAEIALVLASAGRMLDRCSRLHSELLHIRPSLGIGDVPVIVLRAIPSYFA